MAVTIRKPSEPAPVKITTVIGGPGGDSPAVAEAKTEEFLARQLAYALGLTTYETTEAVESTDIKIAVSVDPPQGTPTDQVVVEFATRGVREHKALIERCVEQEIARTTNKRSGNLLEGWSWELRRFRSGDMPDHDPEDVLCEGEKWVFTPTGPARLYAAQINHLVNQRGGTSKTPVADLSPVAKTSLRGMFVPTIEFWCIGSGRARPRQARSRGFMASAINQVRRQSDGRWWTKVKFENA